MRRRIWRRSTVSLDSRIGFPRLEFRPAHLSLERHHKRLWRRILSVKARLARLLPKPSPGVALNKYFAGEGDIVFAQACRLGCEGIVSKRLGSTYRFGRSKQWVRIKNPAAPAVRREAEEYWGRLW